MALLKTSELRPKPMTFLKGCTALTTTRPHNSVVVGSSPTRPTLVEKPRRARQWVAPPVALGLLSFGCLIGGGSSEMGSHRFSMSSSGIIFELGVLYLGGDE